MLNAQNARLRKVSAFEFCFNISKFPAKMTRKKGKLYISTRGGVTLCGACYRGGAKPELTFNVRERPGRALKPG